MNKFSQFPHYPRLLAAFPRYHPPYPLPYAEVPEPMSYTIYPSDAGFNAPAESPHYYSKSGFTPSAGARFVQTPYAYENPYDAYAEDIQYSTVEPLMEPIPYTRQWQSGWGSANQEDDSMGGFFANIGGKLKKAVGKGKTRRSARRSARKAKRAKRKGTAPTSMKGKGKGKGKRGDVSVKMRKASVQMRFPNLDTSFQSSGPAGRSTSLFAKSLVSTTSAWDKAPLPRRNSTLFQGKTLQTQAIAKPIMQALNPQQAEQQAQLTARAQESEKSEEKATKGNALLWGGAAVTTLLAAGGGFYWWQQNKKKKQGSQYYGPKF